MYLIEYLPKSQQDLIDIVRYISSELHNPEAANALAINIINSIDGISDFPYSTQAYRTIKPLKHEYRRLIVENYIVFYWIDEDKKTITVARVLYAQRNHQKLLEK